MDANRQVHERIEARLITLRREYDAGQLNILQAERELTSLLETVLRISGAILALEELLSPLAPAADLKEQPESNRFGHNCRSQIAPSMQAKHAKSHGLPAAKRFHRLSC
jgi:hypothetical protein